MFTQIQNLKRGQKVIVGNVVDGDMRTVTIGHVRTRDGQATIFCEGWISPVMHADDMLYVAR